MSFCKVKRQWFGGMRSGCNLLKEGAPLACTAEREREMDFADRMSTYVDELRRGIAIRHSLRHGDCLAASEGARVDVSWVLTRLKVGRFQLRIK